MENFNSFVRMERSSRSVRLLVRAEVKVFQANKVYRVKLDLKDLRDSLVSRDPRVLLVVKAAKVKRANKENRVHVDS
jgi:hypothetical protein